MDHAALATHPIQGQGRAHSHSIDEGSMQPLLGGSMGYDHRSRSSIDYTPNHITEFGVPLSGLQRPLSNDFSNWYPGQSHAAASQAGFGAPARRTSYTPVTIPQQHVAPVPVITNPPPGQISHPRTSPPYCTSKLSIKLTNSSITATPIATPRSSDSRSCWSWPIIINFCECTPRQFGPPATSLLAELNSFPPVDD
ncbi:hypothetical protein BDN72DRAFT_433430 [Pluteus cervinus]|uniref:Uncharacterized protein n=1 Tax=Pluteus cervinus TaxID=181527 RepID=A0ACD3B1U0_9AGAR|nr:hypothetical protein BDN72DRAFT_433430 [Pluteus cervinus]